MTYWVKIHEADVLKNSRDFDIFIKPLVFSRYHIEKSVELCYTY